MLPAFFSLVLWFLGSICAGWLNTTLLQKEGSFDSQNFRNWIKLKCSSVLCRMKFQQDERDLISFRNGKVLQPCYRIQTKISKSSRESSQCPHIQTNTQFVKINEGNWLPNHKSAFPISFQTFQQICIFCPFSTVMITLCQFYLLTGCYRIHCSNLSITPWTVVLWSMFVDWHSVH